MFCYEIYMQGVRNHYLTTVRSKQTAIQYVRRLNLDFLRNHVHKDFNPKNMQYDPKNHIYYYPTKDDFDEVAPFHYVQRSYGLSVSFLEAYVDKHLRDTI